MSKILDELKYTKDHEWAKIENNTAIIGITDFAQNELGDIVYIELPEKGSNVNQGQSFGEIEAVKTVADLNSPLSGKIIEVNEELNNNAGIINTDPYNKGWIVKIELSDQDEIKDLLDAKAYGELN